MVLYHLSALTEAIREICYFEIGKMGVDIFFIISGYVMTLICERNEPTDLFLKKRVIRIMPLYILVSCLVIVANYRVQFISGDYEVWSSLFKSLFLIPHYSIANELKIFPIFIPGWTITYEMWFYILIAVVGVFCKSSRKIMLVPALLVSLYLLSQLLPKSAVGQFLGNSVYLTFAIGIFFRLFETRRMPLWAATISVIGLFIVAFLIEGLEARLIIFGIPALLIFLIVFRLPIFSINGLAYVGKISFSLYLTHVFVINIVERIARPIYPDLSFGMELMLVFAFVLSILVAACSYSLFENKLDRFLRSKFA